MKSKKSEIIFHDGEVREEPGAIHLLVSGRLTAWIEGIPVHSVEPGEFLDSIEWKAKLNQRLKGEELFKNHREKISQLYYQIRIQSDVPSTYIKLNQHQLKHLERHRPGIFGIFVAVVGRDVAKKMYNLNEHLTLADQVAYKALHRKHSLMRSLSVDTIHTASNGFIVTENWFISCRHKDTQFIKSEKVPSLSSLAYLKEKSSNHCRHQVVIPSLSLQKRLTFWNECPYSKRLSKKESRDPHWKRDILWSSALAHCGFCSWCRPLTVGEKEHASGKRAGETTLEQELQLY
uniref:Blood vessel epicardial substancelike [Megachile rotundata] n=1 Tax=Lepeophtheirus salmonis TaxID=72036 RepID=A0A0K2T6C7_LEPSM